MTAKRDSKRKPKKDERPKLAKEKLKDLDVSGESRVEGGARPPRCTYMHTQCTDAGE